MASDRDDAAGRRTPGRDGATDGGRDEDSERDGTTDGGRDRNPESEGATDGGWSEERGRDEGRTPERRLRADRDTGLPEPPTLALTNYPRMLAAYYRRGEDGLADLEEKLRREAAARPGGKFGKAEALYTPFVPLPPADFRHKCGHCRFWVDHGPDEPGECMIVGREGDYAGGKAIHEQGGCALFVPPAGERAFAWLSEQASPTGADLVRGEWHAPDAATGAEDGVEIPVIGPESDADGQAGAGSQARARQQGQDRGGRDGRARRQPTETAVGDTEVPTGATVALEPVVTGLAAPVAFVPDPAADDEAGQGRWFVADQPGQVHVYEDGPDGDGLREEPLLDLADRTVELVTQYDERGLLGLALHPEFAENGRLFVRYSAPRRDGTPRDYDHTEVLAEFEVGEDRGPIDPESERTVVEIPSPQFNHDAGDLAFGPDGHLYLGMGDGGGEGDRGPGHVPGGNGQDVTENLLGGILRIDPDGEAEIRGEQRPYAIPDDNPLVGEAGLDEYYAWGLRNPWRLSFDDEGRLFVADVGQHLFEEVNVVERGGNYGWPVREGFHCFDPDTPSEPPADCPDESDRGEPLLDPILEYPHVDGEGVVGSAIVGGHVYEGDAVPALDGAYVFGDWATTQDRPSGRLFAARPPDATGDGSMADDDGGGGNESGGDARAGDGDDGGSDRWRMEELVVSNTGNGRPNRNVLAFGRGPDGELYVCSSGTHVPGGETGAVHRIVPAGE